MNRAQQKAVAHEANVGLVNIRNLEVQYFGRFFSNFGTQAAFMIGFILSAISQVPGDVNVTKAPLVFVVFFWVRIKSRETTIAAVYILFIFHTSLTRLFQRISHTHTHTHTHTHKHR
jgi:hypothetical protein